MYLLPEKRGLHLRSVHPSFRWRDCFFWLISPFCRFNPNFWFLNPESLPFRIPHRWWLPFPISGDETSECPRFLQDLWLGQLCVGTAGWQEPGGQEVDLFGDLLLLSSFFFLNNIYMCVNVYIIAYTHLFIEYYAEGWNDPIEPFLSGEP